MVSRTRPACPRPGPKREHRLEGRDPRTRLVVSRDLGKQVWLTTATEDGKHLSALCLDRETGKVIYDLPMFTVETSQVMHKFNSYASPTPVIEEGRVYLSWGAYGIACVDTTTGKTLWVRRDLLCEHYRGPGASPILHGDLLIQHYDGFDYQYCVAVNKRPGRRSGKPIAPPTLGLITGT